MYKKQLWLMLFLFVHVAQAAIPKGKIAAGAAVTAGVAAVGVKKKLKKKIEPIRRRKEQPQEEKLPIVYHPGYNISFWGIEKFLHSFDGSKYSKVYNYLTEQLGLHPQRFYAPETAITEQELIDEQIHTEAYLASLSYSSNVARIAEVAPLAWVPNWLLQRKLLQPMRLAVAGTMKALELAQKEGWAINLSGGYHHAKPERGEGFCVYSDIALAAKAYLKQHPNKKVLIVDLDAHQGNGHEMCLKDEKRAFIFDMYNKHIYPRDRVAQQSIDFNLGIPIHTDSQTYLALLEKELPKAIKEVKPDLIIYVAGTDIYEDDRLGALSVSAQAIIERDRFVFQQAKGHDCAVLMLLAGGYTPESWEIISHSIEQVLKDKECIAA